MILDEFLIALGLKVDNADLTRAEQFGDSLDGIADSADQAESSMVRAYDATDGFVSAIEGAMGVIGFFTGVLGGAFAFFHGTITELEDLIKEEKLLTDVTADQLEQQKKYVESVETLGKRYNSLKVELAFGFLPTMQRMIEALDGWLESNKDLIVNGISTLLTAITKTLDVVINFIRFIDLIIEKTIGWENMLYVLGAALIWLNRAMLIGFATNPVFWIMAAIAGLLILVDDFMTYLDGGESEFAAVWGSMLGWVKENEEALRSLWDMLILGMSYLIEFGAFVGNYMGGAFLSAFKVIADVFILLYALFSGNTELMKEAWSGMIQNFISIFRNFAMLFEPMANAITNVFNSMLAKIKPILSSIYTAIVTPFKAAFDWIVDKFSQIPSMISNIISKLPGIGIASTIGSAVGNTAARIVNNYGGSTQASINVTAPDAISAGNQIQSTLRNTQAQRNFGGAARA